MYWRVQYMYFPTQVLTTLPFCQRFSTYAAEVLGTAMAQVEGDSMVDVGIMDGDYVLARHQTTANQGEIIVAVIDGDATVKRYYVDGDGVQLVAENEAYAPIVVEPHQDFRIAGKIVSLMRRF